MKQKIYTKPMQQLLIRLTYLLIITGICTLKSFGQIVVVNPTSPWTVPAGVTSVKVEIWGGGGGGGGAKGALFATAGAGGGGGGAYKTATLAVSGGQTYTISTGGGGAGGSTAPGAGATGGVTSFTGPAGTVTANGGAGGAAANQSNSAGGAGGTGGTFNGGNGGTSSGNGAGGGGGAGNNAAGGAGANSTTGAGGAGVPNAAPYIGGTAGAFRTSAGTGNTGSVPGGGGGGGMGQILNGTASGGAGSAGQVVLTYTLPAPLITSFGTSGGCVGTSITINGSFFTGATAANVQIGGTPVTAIISNTGSQIVATIGSGTTGTVSVTTTSGTGTSAAAFTVFPLPSAPSVTPSAATVAAGLTTNFNASGTGTSFAWYSAATGGTLLANTASYSPPASCSNATFYAEQTSSAGCVSSRTSTTLTRTPTPAPSVTPPSATVIAGQPASFTASGIGSSFAWYSAATGGTLLGSSASFNSPGSCANTSYFAEQTANGCASSRTSASVTTTPLSAPTGTDGSVCGLGIATISGTPATGGNTCSWYDAPSGGNLLLANSTTAPVTINASGSYTFYASTKNSTVGCESTARTAVTATSLPQIIAAPSLSATSVCPGNSITAGNGASRSGKSTVSVSIPLALFSTTNANSPLTVSGFSSALNNTSVKINFVKINIAHNTVGNLRVRLVAPDASVFNLSNQNGGSGVNYTNTVFQTGGTAITSGTAPFSGTFAPQQAFSNFNGKNPNGTWTLNVQNIGGISAAGTLLNWEINFVDANGLTYSWTSTPAGINSTSSSVTDNPSQNTSYNIVVSGPGGCTASGASSVTMKPVPQADASSNAPICDGLSLTLFGNNLASGQSTGNTWSWSGPSFSSTAQNPTISGATTSATGTYTLTITNSLGCTSSTSTSIAINSNPVLAIATQTNVLCNGQSNGSVDIDASSGTPSYLFDLNGSSTLDGIYSDLPAGSYAATAVDDNGCEAGALTVNITQPNVLTVNIGSNSPACTGTALNINSTPAGGTSGYFFAWTGPNSFTSTLQNPTISSVTSAEAGQYDLQVTDVHGCITSSNHTAAIIAAPTATIINNGSNNVCFTQPASFQLTFTGTGPWNYTVSDGSQTVNGSSSLNPANITIIPTTVGTHNYIVTAISDANCPAGGTSSGTATVEVITAPPVNSISAVTLGAQQACVGSVMQITTNSVSGQNISYSWNTGSNSSGVLFSANAGGPFLPPPFETTSPQVYAQFGSLAGSSGYSICVQGVNGCGSTNNKCSWVRGIVSVPGTIAPAANIVACPNDVKSYSCGLSAGATIYNWTLAGSSLPVTSGQGTPNVQVTFPPVFTTGQLCVTASLSCGGSSVSSPRCMTVSNNPSIPSSLTGLAKVCPGATGITYSVPSVAGASGYNWTTPAGTTITSGAGTNSITVNFPTSYTGAPPVCVSATGACGTSVAKCKTVGSNIPVQPGSITGPATNICNSTVQYAISNVSGASSYTWTNPSGTTIASGQGSTTILLNIGSSFTNGPLTVVANTSACTPGTSNPRTITISGKPNTPGSITANPAAWCDGASVNFSTSTVSPIPTYNWTVTNGSISAGQTSNNIDVNWGTGSGNVNVNASNSCGTSGTRSQSFSSSCREAYDFTSEDAFSVYPNPAHDKLTISIDAKENATYTIVLTDITGRVMMSENLSSKNGLNKIEMNTSHLAKGVYMLAAEFENEVWKTKVVIE